MKTLTIVLVLLLSLVAGLVPASAQTAITTTTITEPVTNAAPTQTILTVAATTGMAVNGVLYLDGSVYRILAISGLNVTVIQQRQPATHLDNAKVWVVPLAAQVGQNPVGSCIRSTAGTVAQGYSPYTIMFNLTTGDMATCRGATGGLRWYITNQYGYAPSADPPVTP